MITTKTWKAALATRNALSKEALRVLGWTTNREALEVERHNETILAGCSYCAQFKAESLRALLRAGCVTAEKTDEHCGALRATAFGRVVYDVDCDLAEAEAERRAS